MEVSHGGNDWVVECGSICGDGGISSYFNFKGQGFLMKQLDDKQTIEMPLSTPANPLTEREIRNELQKIIAGPDKKARRIARETLRKRLRYKIMEE